MPSASLAWLQTLRAGAGSAIPSSTPRTDAQMPHHGILSPTRAKAKGQVSARGHGRCPPPHHQRGQPQRGHQSSALSLIGSMGTASSERPVGFPMCAANAGGNILSASVTRERRWNPSSSLGMAAKSPALAQVIVLYRSIYVSYFVTLLSYQAFLLTSCSNPTLPSSLLSLFAPSLFPPFLYLISPLIPSVCMGIL